MHLFFLTNTLITPLNSFFPYSFFPMYEPILYISLSATPLLGCQPSLFCFSPVLCHPYTSPPLFLSIFFPSVCHRAGHATILPRNATWPFFRPRSCLLLQYYYIWCGYSIKTQGPTVNIFRVFSGPWGSITLSRCCIVALSLSRSFTMVPWPALVFHSSSIPILLVP